MFDVGEPDPPPASVRHDSPQRLTPPPEARAVIQLPAPKPNTDDFWNGLSQETGIQTPSPRPRPKPTHLRRKSRLSKAKKPTTRRPITPDPESVDPRDEADLESQVKHLLMRYTRAKALSMSRSLPKLRLTGGDASSVDPTRDPIKSKKLQAKMERLQRLSDFRQGLDSEATHELNARIRELCDLLEIELDAQFRDEDTPPPPSPSPPPPRPFIKPLSDTARSRIPSVTSLLSDPNAVLAKFGRERLSAKDLLKVLPASSGAVDHTGAPVDWLNDEAINSFFALLCDAARTKLNAFAAATGVPIPDSVPRFHAFSSFWYTQMKSKAGYKNVERWARRAKCGGADLLKVERLFIPVNLGQHWVLAVVEPSVRRARAYDSLGSRSVDSVLNAVHRYLAEELGPAWDPEEWAFQYGPSGQQANMNDCGVYTCFNALAVFYGNPSLLIGSRDLSDAREVMAAILMAGGFVDEFDLETYHDGFSLLPDPVVGVVGVDGVDGVGDANGANGANGV